MFGSCNRTTATATALWMLRERERGTNERESHSRQAGCVELVVCGRYMANEESAVGRQAEGVLLWNEERRQTG